MNKQEMFNAAYLGVIKQGKPAMNDTKCVYRAADGSKCAMGHLITDEEYAALKPYDTTREINGCGVHGIKIDSLPKRISEELNFIAALQHCHDNSADAASSDIFLLAFKGRMASLAKKNGLTIPEIPQ